MKIAALGGEGHPGTGRVRRRAAAGHELIIGSGAAGIPDRVQAAAAEMQSAPGTCGA